MADMNKAVYDSKQALPNKLMREDGSITDLAGNPTIGAVDAYENKQALPNKWLNPDGSYSTLNEIVASMIDNDIFVIVDELPETGETDKIYLLATDNKLVEYLWVDGEWDPVGMVEFDITNYYTKSEVTQLISASLQSAKDYADTKASAAETNAKAYAKSYADGLAGNYDIAGAASTAETNAKSYADTKKSEAVASANGYTDTAIQTSITQVLGGSY